jgi:hypothetical protein
MSKDRMSKERAMTSSVTAATIAWLRTWKAKTQFSHSGAATVARHTGARV